jgi:hypothetical protein
LDLFDFIDLASSSHIEDSTYNKIIGNWSEFIGCLPDDEDKQLFLKIMSICYFKYQKAIVAYGISDYDLSNGLLLSILIDQQIKIDGLKYK